MESWNKEHSKSYIEMRANSLPLIAYSQIYKVRLRPSLFMGYIKRYMHYIFHCKNRLGPTTFSLYSVKTETGKCGGLEKYGRAAQREREGRVQQHNTIIL